MSTRANIVLKESWKDYEGNKKTHQLFFYRHSDGYPDGTMPTLNIFIEWLKKGKIRTDLMQAAGWLIILGAMEYNSIPKYGLEEPTKFGSQYGNVDTIEEPKDWKVGAYEPTTGIHGDIEYLYVIDLNKKEVKCFQEWTDEGEGKGKCINLNKVLKTS